MGQALNLACTVSKCCPSPLKDDRIQIQAGDAMPGMPGPDSGVFPPQVVSSTEAGQLRGESSVCTAASGFVPLAHSLEVARDPHVRGMRGLSVTTKHIAEEYPGDSTVTTPPVSPVCGDSAKIPAAVCEERVLSRQYKSEGAASAPLAVLAAQAAGSKAARRHSKDYKSEGATPERSAEGGSRRASKKSGSESAPTAAFLSPEDAGMAYSPMEDRAGTPEGRRRSSKDQGGARRRHSSPGASGGGRPRSASPAGSVGSAASGSGRRAPPRARASSDQGISSPASELLSGIPAEASVSRSSMPADCSLAFPELHRASSPPRAPSPGLGLAELHRVSSPPRIPSPGRGRFRASSPSPLPSPGRDKRRGSSPSPLPSPGRGIPALPPPPPPASPYAERGGRYPSMLSSVVGRRCVACPKGTTCRRQRDAKHLELEAHPFDPDYAQICEATGVEMEQPSLRGLFEWIDVDDSNKISKAELEAGLPLLAELFGEPVHFSAKAWERLDEDGNGCVNFSEFAAWAGPRLGLPLGVAHLFHTCSIMGCPCAKYEASSKKKQHTSIIGKKSCEQTCTCGHKRGSHNDQAPSGHEVPYPSYWNGQSGEFSSLVPVETSMLKVFQRLFDATYKNKWTRDRKKHNPADPQVPKGYQVVRAMRSENSKYWQEYSVRRAQLSRSRAEFPEEEFVEYRDVKPVVAWEKFAGVAADRLRPECNEWYLFHGTCPQSAERICKGDFKINLAGSTTGTLYGKGCYFSESSTKADEYAKANAEGERALILCRALGGHVRYTAEVEPDPEELTECCIEGNYDCILGDREKCRDTFREFVFYDTENIYAEYVIFYKRIY